MDFRCSGRKEMEVLVIMNKSIITLLGMVWIIGVFYLGWKTVLWTIVGIAIGMIIKQLKENV